jgi:hypothetical protein
VEKTSDGDGASDTGALAAWTGEACAANFAGRSDLSAGRGRGSGIASGAGAAIAPPVSTAAANATMSRRAVNGTDLSGATPPASRARRRCRSFSSAGKIEESLTVVAIEHGNRQASRQKRGMPPVAEIRGAV